MWSYFNQFGILTEPALTHGNAARVGTTDFEIFAYFEGIDLDLYDVATIRFQKPDLYGTEYPTMFMYKKTKTFNKLPGDSDSTSFVDEQQYTGFSFNFGSFAGDEDVAILLDTAGLWYATITLYNGSQSRNVTGILTFNVQEAVSSADSELGTELNIEDIENNMAPLLAGMLPKESTYYVKPVDNFIQKSAAKTLLKNIYTVGSYVFDQTTKAFYLINSVVDNPNDSTYVGASDYTKIEIEGGGGEGGSQTSVAFIASPLTNVNNKVLTSFTSENVTVSGYAAVKIKNASDGTVLSKANATIYMNSVCGNEYVPEYNFDYPAYSYLIDANGVVYKPQWDETNGLLLYIVTNPFAKISDIPTKTSQLTNDSDFITPSYHDSSKQDALVSGTNIKTINNESILGSGNISISAPTYTAGTGIDITAGTISVDSEVVAMQSDLPEGEIDLNFNDSTTTVSSTEALNNVVAGNKKYTVTSTSASAASGGTTLSLVTTGEKYTWNNKMSNPMTTSQDIIVGGSSGTPGRLAKGSNGDVLRVNSSGNIAYGKGLPFIDCTGVSPTYPSAANTDGLILVLCSSDPSTKYSGYIYVVVSGSTPSGYSVTVSYSGGLSATVYDGQDSTGTQLVSLFGGDSQTVTCTSGYLYLDIVGSATIAGSNGATSTNPSTITANGATITITGTGGGGSN